MTEPTPVPAVRTVPIMVPRASNPYAQLNTNEEVLRNVRPGLPPSILVHSVDEAIRSLERAYAENAQQPVHAVMVAHGEPGAVEVGFNLEAETRLQERNEAVLRFVGALCGKIRRLSLVCCNTAQQAEHDDNHLMRQLAQGLASPDNPTVTIEGYDGPIGWRWRPRWLALLLIRTTTSWVDPATHLVVVEYNQRVGFTGSRTCLGDGVCRPLWQG